MVSNMEIIGLTSLTDKQTKEVQALQQYCMDYDCFGRELFLSNDINFYKDMPCFFLSYLEEELYGVLVVFAPTMETAEISTYVHPDHRRIGVFSGLLLKAWRIVHQYQISRVLMVTDSASTVCKEIFNKWQAKLSHSEYLMAYENHRQPLEFPFAKRCKLREATEVDFEKMIEMNMSSFGEDWDNASHMVRENFNHQFTRCFVGQMDDEIFGLVNVRKEGSALYICGFNIAPAHQGKGMGRYLLQQLLDYLAPSADENITLEVDSNNQPAFRLYTKSGFVVKAQTDYYLLELPII
jgi:ribosomal protein S18 acetylase RimI-like enzyme